MKRRLRDAGEDTILVCPDCDTSNIRRRGGGYGARDAEQPPWQCQRCGSRFNEAHERPRKSVGACNADTLAARLEAADPDDLVTDGGLDMSEGELNREETIEACQSRVKEVVWHLDDRGANPQDIADALDYHARSVRAGMDSPDGWELKEADNVE